MALSQDEVSRLYTNILGREADQAGLDFWSNSGLGVGDVEKQFRGSQEATDNINRQYNQYLYRDADQAGLEFWRANLGLGFGYNDFAQQLQNSDEYNRYVDPIKSAYSTFLPNQQADDAGIDYWVDQYRASGNEDPIAQQFASLGGITPESYGSLSPEQSSMYMATLDKFGLDPLSVWRTPGAAAEGNFQWQQGLTYDDTSWNRLSQADRNRIIQTMYGEDSYSPDGNIAQVIRNSLYYGNDRWEGHKRLGDTVENVTRAQRFNAWGPNDNSYKNNTSKFNPDHPRWGEYAAVAEEIFNNKKPKHEYAYYATKQAKPGSTGYQQWLKDVQAGRASANDQMSGERHDFFAKTPGIGFAGEGQIPPVRPDYEGTQQTNIATQGTPLDSSQGLQPIGYDAPFPLSTDQYTFTGGPNYTASGGTGFQPIGAAGQPAIFTSLPLDPSAGYNLGLGLPYDFSPAAGTGDGFNTNANVGVDAIQPLYTSPVGSGFSSSLSGSINLGFGGDVGFSLGYNPATTYGAYNSAF